MNNSLRTCLILLLLSISASCAFLTAQPATCFLAGCHGRSCSHAASQPLFLTVPNIHTQPRIQLHDSDFARKFILGKYRALSSSDTSGDQSDGMEGKIIGRKKRIMIGYRASAIIYLLLGISTFIPGIMKPSLFALAINYSSGPLLASGIAYILIGAAENDRLGSDTYKRLNLFLSVFGILWLVAAIFIKKTDQLMHGAKIVANPLVVFASFSAVANGIKGWAYGAKGWDKAGNTTYIEDFKELVKSSWDILVSPIKNMRAGLYLAGTAYVALLKLFHLQMLFGVGRETITAARYGSWFIAFAKLQLLFMASLTLVDAAKRDRLAGATFIELNIMSAFAWIATSAFLFISGQVYWASLATLFSSFSLFSGMSCILKKRKTSK